MNYKLLEFLRKEIDLYKLTSYSNRGYGIYAIEFIDLCNNVMFALVTLTNSGYKFTVTGQLYPVTHK